MTRRSICIGNHALLTSVGLLLCTPAAFADDCSRGKSECTINIDLAEPKSPGNLTVDNNTAIVVQLTKILPIEECSVVRDKRDVVPEPDVIAELSKAVAAAAGAFTGLGGPRTMRSDCSSHLRKLLALEQKVTSFLRNDHRVQYRLDEASKLKDEIDQILRNAPACTASDPTGLGIDDALKEALKRAYGYLLRVRYTLELIEEGKPPTTRTLRLPSDRNATATYTAACKNLESGTPSGLPVTFTVLYQDLPRVSFSVGALVSFVPKRTIAVVPVVPESNADYKKVRVPTMAEGESIPQAIPFSFLHYRFAQWSCGRRDFVANLTGGLGVNSNSGSNQAEFALGPSMSIGRLNLFLGYHAARPPRLIPAFEAVLPPDRIISKDVPLPIEQFWSHGAAFGVSFRIF